MEKDTNDDERRGRIIGVATRCYTDGNGDPHNWRADLCKKLTSLQNKDGSWVNTADRWHEGNPNLVTAYAVLALQSATQ